MNNLSQIHLLTEIHMTVLFWDLLEAVDCKNYLCNNIVLRCSFDCSIIFLLFSQSEIFQKCQSVCSMYYKRQSVCPISYKCLSVYSTNNDWTHLRVEDICVKLILIMLLLLWYKHMHVICWLSLAPALFISILYSTHHQNI